MNKVKTTWLILFSGLSGQAFAKAGIADGGFEFLLVIVGFLLLVTGLFAVIEYMVKNGRNLFFSFRAFLIRKS